MILRLNPWYSPHVHLKSQLQIPWYAHVQIPIQVPLKSHENSHQSNPAFSPFQEGLLGVEGSNRIWTAWPPLTSDAQSSRNSSRWGWSLCPKGWHDGTQKLGQGWLVLLVLSSNNPSNPHSHHSLLSTRKYVWQDL